MRTLSRFSAVALVAALAFGVSSCSGDEPGPKTAPEPSASSTDKNEPVNQPTADPATHKSGKPGGKGSVICREPETLTPFSGTAVAKFGADEVMDAYCEMADFFYLNAVTNLTPPQVSVDPVELSWAKEWMAPDLAAEWDGMVRKAVSNLDDPAAGGDIQRITFFNLRGLPDGYSFPEAGSGLPKMIGGGVGSANAKVSDLDDGRSALDMYFTVTTNIVVQKDGEGFALPAVREVGLRLTPSGESIADPHSWLMEGWTIDTSTKPVEPLSSFAANTP